MEDPHRNLLGALANINKAYTVIRLLGSEHHLEKLKLAAFPNNDHNN